MSTVSARRFAFSSPLANTRLFSLAIFAGVLSASRAFAAPTTLYYDTNGAAGGTSASSTQNFTDAVWTLSSTGTTATTGYTVGSDIVFSANDGVNAGTGTQNVTVTDTESADGFTFDNGVVTLYGSGGPNLSIGAGGITVNSTVNGATTFDSSLGTVALSSDQSWNNDSSRALTINSAVNGSGHTLTLAGTGGGSININGQLTGGLNLTQDSTSSTLYLNNTNNNFGGTITVNGGGLVFANEGSLNGNNITLSNGGVLESANEVFSEGNDDIYNTVNLGTGGGAVSGGVVGSYGVDTIFSGTFTGGTGLTVVNGDFITQNDGTSNVGTLTIADGSRLLAGSAGLFGNNAVVQVDASTLDFGWNNYGGTLNNAITLTSGSAIENRGSGMTLTNVMFPTLGTVTLGSDDDGAGSLTITSDIDLTNALTIDLNGTNNGTSVTLGGTISGSGALIVNEAGNGRSPLTLSGNNNYNGPTTLNDVTVYTDINGFGTSAVTLNSATVNLGGAAPNSFIASTGTSTLNLPGGVITGGPISVAAGATLDVGASGTLNSTVTLADGSALENNGGNVVLNGLVLPTNGTVTLGTALYGGGSMTFNGPIDLANAVTLDVDANGGNTTTVNFAGPISGSGALTINPGPGGNSLLEFSGNNTYSGPITLNSVTVEDGSATGFGTSAITANSSAINLTGGTFTNSVTANTGYTGINLVANADEKVSSPLTLSSNGGSLYFANYTTSNNLTVGGIDFGSTGGGRAVYFNDASTGMITLVGTYNSPGSDAETESGSTIVFGSNGNNSGNYTIGPDANFANFETNGFSYGQATITLDAGTLYLDNSSFIGSQVFGATGGYAGANQTYALVGSQDIQAQLYVDDKHGPVEFGGFTVEQSTQDESIWAGQITMDATAMTVSAVDGGRLEFTGDVSGGSPIGLFKTGAGVVVFDDPNGNNFGLGGDGYSAGVNSSVAIDIQQGTLLVNNSQGYGLGNNGGTVNVEKGAIFGGNNTLAPSQTVVSEDAGSIIAPGDAGQASLGIAPTIGTINLTGGLTTANNADPTTDGVTLDFKLNGYADGSGSPVNNPGVNNDFITVTNLTLNGTVTINLTAIGTAPLLTGTGNEYILIEGHGFSWSGDPTFVINTPDGYALDNTFGTADGLGDGYDLGYEFLTRASGQVLAVQLIAVPEPSTYGLLGLGLLGLVAFRRVRKLHA